MLISICVIFFTLTSCEIEKPKYSLSVDNNQPGKVKNIILMIADGCGFNHIDAANSFQYGKLNSQKYQKFPVYFPVSTSPALSGKFKTSNGLSWNNGYNSGLTYIDSSHRSLGATGSGSAATAIATGRKTYNGSIGMDIDFKPLKSILNKAKELGKSTGVVTSVPFAHATPASFVVNNVNRNNYMKIATDMINSDVDIIFGCGNPDYNSDGEQENTSQYKYLGGKEMWSNLKSNKVKRKLITDKNEFESLITNPIGELLLGIPKVHTTLQVARSGNVEAGAFEIELTDNIPSLIDMSLASLQCLNLNKNGFFVMIEGGAVDWAAHSNHSGRMIEELIEFNNTVDSIINWVETYSNWDETLLIVTADHETGYLTGNAGFNSRIEPKGKELMPDMIWNSGSHTNVLIPLFAKGNGSELFDDYADEVDSLRGYFIQNSEIGQVMFRVFN